MRAKDRLRRSESTRFARTSHDSSLAVEPFDPEIARLYATAAASKAMSRSRARTYTRSEGSYDRLGGPHGMAIPPKRYKRPESSDPSGDDLHPCHSSSTPLESPDHGQPWCAALPSISEFGGLEDRIASLPSSYRRLRKSRSMFSTKQRSSHIPYGLSSPKSYSGNIPCRVPMADPPRLYRTLRRSMSFLRGDNTSQSTLRHAKSHDVAIELARSQYEQTLLNSPDPPQWTALPMSKVRDHKPFRKTFRTASTSKTSTTSSSVERAKVNEPYGKARAISSSIKNGIKRVLGYSRNPSEQGKVQASPSLSQNWSQSPLTVASDENDYPSDYGSFDIDHLHKPAGVGRPPTARRMQSSGSLATSRSRVTSWADSTAANTLATPKSGGQHRMSIISDRGSLGQADIPTVPPGAIREGRNNAVDSHRLFSALMKRIGGGNAQNPNEEIHLGYVKEHRAVHTQGSLHFHRSNQTIRQVPSDVSVNSPNSFTTANVGPVTPYVQPQDHEDANIRAITRPTEVYDRHGQVVKDARHRAESDSPSVYSRSTSGISPRSKAAADSSDSEAEPGVATIFASERTTYSSPSKSVQSPSVGVSAQPGIDWQNWMDSQIARIESATPDQYHYREDAQIQDDYEPEFSPSVPARRIRVESRGMSRAGDDRDGLSRKVSTNSNFSRPFSRSSSLRTVVKGREPSFNALSSSMPLSAADDIFRDPGGQERLLKPAHARQSDLGVSPMLSRSSNQPRRAESPTPKRYGNDPSPKMNSGKYGQNSTRWSPASQDARMLQRRSARFLRENRKATNENARLERITYERPCGQLSMSSKRMVEEFLNSRRRQMGADIPDDGITEPAFL
ncbi:hypothetical protein BDW59DRAFT_65282 [Aspergillus cavernicola]|uniref:Uncharacterized protein n=1 Tax=Aspergillus cavernicola TaxID=176166 RepID=A0ABR4IFR8_9EURO